jgi:outer membrane protein TolC
MRKTFAAFAVAAGTVALAWAAVAGTSTSSSEQSTSTTKQSTSTTKRTTTRSLTTPSEYSSDSRTFTIDRAIITALQQNPDVLRAKEEIERTKGVVIEITALALPHVNVTANGSWTDPHLGGSSGSISTGTGSGGGGSTISGGTDFAYNIRILGSQLVANYGTFRQIRGTFFQRDSAYFSFRNVVDQTIALVKTQFYQVILNRALIGVQEESVRLLESQLKDQQNRFEAGTVPRFNVLQAQVALSNQYPSLIAARNNYRISLYQLAKTLGLDHDPRHIESPVDVVGEMVYIPRNIALAAAIEMGMSRRPFLKQARANVYNQIEQVHVALGGFLPNMTSTGGYEVFSSPRSTQFADVSKGWVAGLAFNWAIWDSGETYGRVKQQRALLSESKITYDDDVRQVELEVQQAYSNLQQNRELIQSQEKTVEQAEEAERLAKARLDAGAGTQLDVLNAQVQLTTAQSTKLQALFGYNSSLAEFDRVTGATTIYTESFDAVAPRPVRSSIYDTSSGTTATGKRKKTSFPEATTRTTVTEERKETFSK